MSHVTPEMPGSIRLAVRLMWAGAAVTLLGVAVNYLHVDEIRTQVAETADPSMTGQEIDRALPVVVAVLGLFGVLFASLWFLMAVANAEGRRWGRRTATVLGVAYLLVAGSQLLRGPDSWLRAGLAGVTMVLIVAILVLLHRPDASRYYDAMSG